MLHVIMRHLLLPALCRLVIWLDEQWPPCVDPDEDSLRDWADREYDGVPDDPRGLA